MYERNEKGKMDGEDSLGAPASSVYECHSRGIVDTLNDLFDKAEVQLDDARKTDQMLKQSLVDEVKYASKGISEAKHCGIWRKELLLKAHLDVTTKI